MHGFADVVYTCKKKRFVKMTKSDVHKGEDLFGSFSSFHVSARARGKEMMLTIDDESKGVHFFRFGFGMTGSMLVMAPGEATHKHAHVIMEAEDGSHLCFVDQRRFGTWTKATRVWL